VDKVLDADGQELRFRRDGLNLQVDFVNLIQAGNSSSIAVHYSGALASADGSPVEGLKLAYVGDEGSYLLYQGRWFPVSNYGGNRFAAKMRLTVPADVTVIASGKELAPQRQTGKTVYTYEFEQPSFPGTVLAGKYVVQPGTAMGANIALYLKPEHEQFAASYGEAAAKILAFFSDRFGALPSDRLAIAEIEDGTVSQYAPARPRNLAPVVALPGQPGFPR
jgi:hypothetical protein